MPLFTHKILYIIEVDVHVGFGVDVVMILELRAWRPLCWSGRQWRWTVATREVGGLRQGQCWAINFWIRVLGRGVSAGPARTVVVLVFKMTSERFGGGRSLPIPINRQATLNRRRAAVCIRRAKGRHITGRMRRWLWWRPAVAATWRESRLHVAKVLEAVWHHQILRRVILICCRVGVQHAWTKLVGCNRSPRGILCLKGGVHHHTTVDWALVRSKSYLCSRRLRLNDWHVVMNIHFLMGEPHNRHGLNLGVLYPVINTLVESG